MPINFSRLSLSVGDSLTVWSRAGGLDPAAWAAAGPSPFTPAWRDASDGPVQYWDRSYYHELTVPPDARPGLYQFTHAGAFAGAVVVASRPERHWQTLGPGASKDLPAAFELALRRGDLDLGFGYYPLSRPVVVPAGRAIRGYGAYLEILGPCAFTSAPGLCLEGLTLFGRRDGADNGSAPSRLFDERQGAAAVTLRRCRFDGLHCRVGACADLLAECCHWHRCGVEQLGRQMLLRRCLFTGRWPGNSTVVRRPGSAILDCRWEGTDRGPVYQTAAPITDSLLVWPVMRDIAHVENGCEGHSVEGPYPFDGNLAFHLRYQGDGPAISVWDCPASGNLWRDIEADGGGGIVFGSDADPAPVQAGNQIYAGELRGGGLTLGKGTTGTRLYWLEGDERKEWLTLVAPRPTRSNQFGGLAPAVGPAVVDLGAGNDAPRVLSAIATA